MAFMKKLLFVFFLTAGTLHANNNIAILEFKARGVDENSSQLMRNTVESALINKAGLSLVEREKLDRLLKEQSLQGSGLTSTENAVRVGRILNAHFLMTGELIQSGKNLTLTLKVVNAENAKTLAVENFSAKSFDDLVEKVNEELDDKFSGLSSLENFFPPYVDGDKSISVKQVQKGEGFEFVVSAKRAGSTDTANFSCEKIDITYFSQLAVEVQGNVPNLSVRLLDENGKKTKAVAFSSVPAKSGVTTISLNDFGIDDEAHYTRIQFFFSKETTADFRILRIEVLP